MSDFDSMDDFEDAGTTVATRPETAIALIPPINPATVFVKDGTKPLLASFLEIAKRKGEGLDISTAKGRTAINSLSRQMGSTIKALDDAGLKWKQSKMTEINVIDAERKAFVEPAREFQAEFRKPLTEWENKDKKRCADHEAAITAMGDLQQWNGALPTSGIIKERLEKLAAYANRPWEEFSEKAGKVAQTVKHWLHVALEKAEKHEAEQAELARLRREAQEREQRDREERIAREAAEKAQKAAEAKAKAEADALVRKAEREKQEAIEAARRQAVAEERERARASMIKAAPVAKEMPVARKIAEAFQPPAQPEPELAHELAEDEAIDAMARCALISEVEAVAVLEAIKRGAVPHVRFRVDGA
jgi:colicin import membrane protein